MAFYETPILPDWISRDAVGGPSWRTEVVQLDSGYEQRNAAWSDPRQRYRIAFLNRTQAQIDELNAFVRAMRGRLHGFRMRDWTDYQVTAANGRLGTSAVGTGLATYQFHKRYTSGVLTVDRAIYKPRTNGATVYRNASPVTVGAGAGQIAIDYTNGIVTFVADQTRSISSHTVGADHVFTLASAFSPNLAIGGYIYVSGITGTAAATLNNLAHLVTNVSGAVVTVATDTTGLTASGGTASFFPQPTDALTWAGTFDVPVRFDVDAMQATAHRTSLGGGYSWDSVELVELRQ
jgi:uncharacterized protein (TIGR02217 family)